MTLLKRKMKERNVLVVHNIWALSESTKNFNQVC